MQKDGYHNPLWLLAELTYICPLQCPYCSNPTDFASQKKELSTAEWLRVFEEARAMGALQLGFSGGEPLIRRDLEHLVKEARNLGFYTNLITSGMGLTEARLMALKAAGLDNIQISLQASTQELNDFLAGRKSFEHKIALSLLIKQYQFPLVFNVVLHRYNIDDIEKILELAIALEANYIELANTQYYGFAFHNKEQLMPSRDQLDRAEKITHAYQARYKNRATIYYVVPDYYETRPKACMNQWGKIFLVITPDGLALPCHSARIIPNLVFPNVKAQSLSWIWKNSPLFNQFRGFDWMQEPCRSCPEKEKDFGGCRCQAYLLTGDAFATDPVCDLSPHHNTVLDVIQSAEKRVEHPLVFRHPKNSKMLTTYTQRK